MSRATLPTAITLPPDLKQKAIDRAASNYESLASYVRRLIANDLKNNK